MSWTKFFRRNRRDDEAAREIASYIAIETDDNIERGMSPQAAHDAAVRKFGNAAQVREDIYWMNTLRPLDTVWQDLKFGARLLWRDKGFAGAAILSLALGIGANTAIFQLMDTVRLRTLPVEQPARLSQIAFAPEDSRSGRFSSRWPDLTYTQFEEIVRRQRVFAKVAAWSSGVLNTAAGGEVKNIEGLWAGGDLFDVLGVKTIIGRPITREDDRAGCGTDAAVISHAYWQRAFGGSPQVLQQTIRLEGAQFPIVGVTGPGFFGLDVGRQFDVAVPLCADLHLQNGVNRFEGRREFWLAAIGRLNPGVTHEQASQHLQSLSAAFMQATLPTGYSADDEKSYLGFKLNATPFGTGVSDVRERFGEPLTVLLAATGLVLLIACANLANLLLARATAREREIAVRLSIGASRARIVGQLLVESVMLAAIGTALGLVAARMLSAVLVAQLAGGSTSVFIDLTWTSTVFVFTAGVSLLACLLFGLAPAVKATSLSPAASLRGTRGVTENRERFGMRRTLVIAQVALSLVLLFGALLFTRTLYNLLTIDPGFDQDVLIVDLTHRSLANEDPAPALAQRVDLHERIAALPGVAGVAIAENVLLSGSSWNDFINVDGPGRRALVDFARVDGGYFDVLSIPLLKGRTFDSRDTRQSPPVAIVNQTFVRDVLNGAEPLGRLFWIEVAPGQPIEKMEIVGVIGDTKYDSIRQEFEPLVHVPIAQAPSFRALARFAVKARGGISGITPSVERVAAAVNPAINVRVREVRRTVRDGLVRERLMAALSGAFGALAGLLAAVGIYGVLSYTVTRRSSEIAIRLAMGARRSEVLRMVIGDAAVLIGIGLVVGMALSLAAARAAQSLLFGLDATDAATVASAIAVLAGIGFLASYLPARRASRVDPMNVLRQE